MFTYKYKRNLSHHSSIDESNYHRSIQSDFIDSNEVYNLYFVPIFLILIVTKKKKEINLRISANPRIIKGTIFSIDFLLLLDMND